MAGRGETITTYESLKNSIYHVMEGEADGNVAARYFNYCMIFLIVLNVIVVVLETVPWIYDRFFWIFTTIDVISFSAFTVEYILRLWICTTNPVFKNPITGRVHYAATPFAIIDLLAIAPFYLPLLIPVDLRFLRILRLLRIIRVLKLGRYSEAVRTFGRVITKKKEQLLIAFSFLLFAIVIASTLMFYAEHDAQPELFASVPHAMWWALVTLATVGYGDMYPITPIGKLIGGIVLIVGIGIFALPTAIMASGFFQETEKETINEAILNEELVCPRCGCHFHQGGSVSGQDFVRTEVKQPPEK
ncbi:MAG: ion transporter [Methanoregula sp.]